MIFLMSLEELWRLLKCYFPVFAAANFSQLFALAIGIPMMFDRYFGALPVNVNLKYTFFLLSAPPFLLPTATSWSSVAIQAGYGSLSS